MSNGDPAGKYDLQELLAYAHRVKQTNHGGHINPYQLIALCERVIELEKIKERFDRIAPLIYQAPELNMGNYNDDDVGALNNAMIEIYHAVLPTISAPTSDKAGTHE